MSIGFSTESESRIKQALDEFFSNQAALLPVLYVAQDQFSHLTSDVLELVAKRLDLPLMHVESVASFYTMYHKQPVGKYHIQVCRTLSCALMGESELFAHLKNTLAIGPGEVSDDGRYSLEEVECLAMCDQAPAMIINKTNYGNLTIEKLDGILNELE